MNMVKFSTFMHIYFIDFGLRVFAKKYEFLLLYVKYLEICLKLLQLLVVRLVCFSIFSWLCYVGYV